MKVYLITIFSFLVLNATAQKKVPNKQVPVKVERIVEITEDVAISTDSLITESKIDFKEEAQPTKNFDTTLVPEDNFTKEIDKLLIEIEAVNNATIIGISYIENELKKDNSLAMNGFYKKFKTALASEEVKKYYRNLFVRIYRKYYTEEEVIQLTSFYKTELGKKTFKNMAIISSEAMIDATKFGEYIGRRIYAESNK